MYQNILRIIIKLSQPFYVDPLRNLVPVINYISTKIQTAKKAEQQNDNLLLLLRQNQKTNDDQYFQKQKIGDQGITDISFDYQ